MLFKEYVVDFVHTLVCKGNSLRLFIKLVVAFKSFPLFWSHVNFIRVVVCFWIFFNFLEHSDVLVNFMEFEGVVFSLSGNDERCSCLIDEDGVNFIDDTEIEATLCFCGHFNLHVVAQVVKSEFTVCSVGKVTAVGGLTCFVVHV